MGTQSWKNTCTMKTFLAVCCILIIPCLVEGALDGVSSFNPVKAAKEDYKLKELEEEGCKKYMVYTKKCSDVAESKPFCDAVKKEYGDGSCYRHTMIPSRKECIVWGPCLNTLAENTWEDIGCGDKQDMKDIGIERVFNAGQFEEEDYKSDIHEEQGCKSYMVFTKKCSDVAESQPFCKAVNEKCGPCEMHTLFPSRNECKAWGPCLD